VLEFDHVRGVKRAEISKLVPHSSSIENIVTEIEKCVVRCANCHCRKTARADWARIRLLGTEKEAAVEEEPLALDFTPEYSCFVLAPLAQW
jgi:hypothetical protein